MIPIETKRYGKVADRFFIIQPTSHSTVKPAKATKRDTPRRVEASKKNRRIMHRASDFNKQINDMMEVIYK